VACCGFLDILGIPAAAIVGWSDGAITGLQLAIAKPGRISKLFAFGANRTVDGMKPNGSRSLGARLALQPDTCHFVMLQHPAEFNRVMIEFLSR
jgi:pimeloyl-ACP methyl ester carboxylesterase